MSHSPSPRPSLHWSLVKRGAGSVVVNDLRIADGFWSRLAGLQFRANLPVGRALVLVKSASVHTFWMRFNLDLVFIGVDGTVLAVQHAVRPWRLAAGPRGTHAILEARAGWIEVDAGDRLIGICANAQDLHRRRKSLWFLDPAIRSNGHHEEPRPKESEQHVHT